MPTGIGRTRWVDMIPTGPAAVVALTWEISCSIGEACEMIEIPVMVKNSAGSMY